MGPEHGGPGEGGGRESPAVVEATRRSIDVMRVLYEEGPTTLTGVADRLGCSKSTVHRHLRTLEEEGYVAESDEGYRLGLLFLDYGIAVREENPLYRVGKPKVDDLAEELDEKVWLMQAENDLGCFIYSAAGRHAVQTFTRDGYRPDLHAYAAGKAILAHVDPDRIDRILSRRGLAKHTENTIVDGEALREELERIRERGVAFNREESMRGINAVGAPILDETGNPTGSISVAGPANRLKGEYLEEELPELLLGVANEIEVSLAFE